MMRRTAALDTTIFWSHSIKTSRNVTFRLSVACRTFPGKGDKIMISKSNWNFVCWTDLTSLHKKAYKYAYADNHVCVGLFINPGCVSGWCGLKQARCSRGLSRLVRRKNCITLICRFVVSCRRYLLLKYHYIGCWAFFKAKEKYLPKSKSRGKMSAIESWESDSSGRDMGQNACSGGRQFFFWTKATVYQSFPRSPTRHPPYLKLELIRQHPFLDWQ